MGILVGVVGVFIEQDVRNLDRERRFSYKDIDSKGLILRSRILKRLRDVYLKRNEYAPLPPRSTVGKVGKGAFAEQMEKRREWAHEAKESENSTVSTEVWTVRCGVRAL